MTYKYEQKKKVESFIVVYFYMIYGKITESLIIIVIREMRGQRGRRIGQIHTIVYRMIGHTHYYMIEKNKKAIFLMKEAPLQEVF